MPVDAADALVADVAVVAALGLMSDVAAVVAVAMERMMVDDDRRERDRCDDDCSVLPSVFRIFACKDRVLVGRV